jgi:outer membrane lipoprotein LolB
VILRAFAAAWLALAAGCATPPQAPGELPWTSGRLSLRVEARADHPAQSLSAAFELQGGADSGELRLNSPLGTLIAAARWWPGMASVRTADGERQFANLDDLSRQALGEALLLAALADWLAGKPWPAAPSVAQTDGFLQLGWQVRTGRLAEGWITARRDAPPAVLLSVRLDRIEP